MKLYDFDGMFDEKLSEYVARNPSKYTEEEWENVIPGLYKKFGDTPVKSLGKSPRAYYGEMSDAELIKCLKAHLKNGVPVPEFLCREIENRKICDGLLPLLDGSADEAEYAVNLLGANPAALDKYMDMLVKSGDEDMKERLADFIKENAAAVTEKAKEYYNKGLDKAYMLDIMSRATAKDDEIFEILIKEFRTDPDNVPQNCAYLASYGDARALEYLLDKIDEEGITFVEFQELKYAVEALGGEYKKQRDFSDDPFYKLIKPD